MVFSRALVLVFYWLPLILRATTTTTTTTHTHTHTHTVLVFYWLTLILRATTHTHTPPHLLAQPRVKLTSFWEVTESWKSSQRGPHPQPLWSFSLQRVCTLPGSPGDASDKEPTCQCTKHKRQGFNPWVGRRKWHPTPIFLPGKSYGQRSLADYSPWGPKRAGHDLTNKQA